MAEKIEQKSDEKDDLARLQSYINEASGALSIWHAQVWSDLKFASGDQWDSDITRARRLKSRPVVTLNQIKGYINRTVNPVRLNPVSASVQSDDKMLNRMVNGVLRGIDRASKASEAYECALECASAAGVGYFSVIVEESSILKGQSVISIKPIKNPCTVLFDPWSEAIDGSDAQYAVVVNWISKDRAKEYGEGATGTTPGWLYGHLACPSDSVGDVVLYEMLDPDDEHEKDEISEEFNTAGRLCRVTRFIGTKMVAQDTYETNWLPIVPMYGDRVWADRNIKWAGMVAQARDNQNLINYYASNELELAALAPKSPFIAGKEQIEGHEKQWASANIEAHSTLYYNMMGPGGVILPAPQRADNTAQTQGLMMSRESASAGMGKLLGISDVMLGGQEAIAESGTALRSRLGTGEIATAQYIDNMAKSIEHGANIQISLMASVYKGIRPVTVVDEKGKAGVARIDVAAALTPEAREMLTVEIAAGPSFESRRKESIASLTQLTQMAGPEAVGQSFDLLAEMMGTPEGDMMAARWRKLHPELVDDGDSEMDPQAKAALQTASEALDHLQELDRQKDGIIAQLQAQVEANEAAAAARVYEAELKAQTDIEIKAMDSNNKVELKLLDLGLITGEQAVQTTELQRSRALEEIDAVEQPDLHEELDPDSDLAPRLPKYLMQQSNNADEQLDEAQGGMTQEMPQ